MSVDCVQCDGYGRESAQSLHRGSFIPFGHINNPDDNSSEQEESFRKTKEKVAYHLKKHI